ncbi:PH domain-containing protein [Rathayibacter toxicus]|uniref:PH domain-containing protein n=1 Tax=Rathayibacter toxicus TaxID=145458 RepID=UPI001C051D14|nr:PH domain-containing protein [Rathayibacter toxicus]QWL31834.1 PH domain-containing protein [Rathayibacter toxicus]QWL33927.1 PH domain-containing protein [Rathayibacter toxicus]QWL36059.1 PH domain-containing protein [Rathayibacter toxicus]QWL38150.1 PH domain-containing protein [Rathayibacter toxicus]QWL40239.1 PH domain-containing protein [Rathayibacter toxicus]
MARTVSDPAEREIARLTPRARATLAPVAGFLLLTWTGCYFAAQFELAVQRWIIGGGTVALAVLLCAPEVMRWASVRYRITSLRLRARRGLIAVRRAEVLFDPRMTVTVRRSLPQRLARCGDVHLILDGAVVFVLRDVPNLELVVAVLRRVIAAAPQPEWPRGR